MKKIKEMGNSLINCCLTSFQKIQVLNTCIRPSITYACAVVPFNIKQMEYIDSSLLQVAKGCLKLGRSTGNAILMNDKNDYGIGCKSIFADTAQQATALLLNLLNDTNFNTQLHTLIGLKNQMQYMGNCPVTIRGSHK